MMFILAQTPEETGSPTPIPIKPPVIPDPILSESLNEQILAFGFNLGLALIIGLVLYVVLFQGLRFVLRRYEKEIGLIALNISQTPFLISVVALSLKYAFYRFQAVSVVGWLEQGLTGLIVLVGSYWISQLFTQVIAYYLKKYAQQSEAMWDDVLIPLLENTIPSVIYVFGILFFIQSLGIDLSGLWVTLGGATVVIGFALKDILANFFSGLVLLIDSPFQFGDVIVMPGGELAIIKKIGIRLTQLLLVETDCEVFVPNANMQNQSITNLSRPSPHYYYSVTMTMRADYVQSKVIEILRGVVFAHPDTLGDIDEKLKYMEIYYNFVDIPDEPELSDREHRRKQFGRERLIAERKVNSQIIQIQQSFGTLIEKIQVLEKGGLESEEVRKVQGYYLEIAKMAGLELVRERQGNQRVAGLKEIEAEAGETNLISLVRDWYTIWSKNPELNEKDPIYLTEEWEKKIDLLKLRMNKLFLKISKSGIDERKLDDYVKDMMKWINERFKSTESSWQTPRIWTTAYSGAGGDIAVGNMEYNIKFYVDNIKLEQCQRGNRVKGEVQSELTRQLRLAYIYR